MLAGMVETVGMVETAASPSESPLAGAATDVHTPSFRTALLRGLRMARLLTFLGARDTRFRSLHLSGGLLALSGIASVALVSFLGAADVADIVALRVLAYGCWLYGGLGLYALLSPQALDTSAHEIALLRGEQASFTELQALGIFGRLSLGISASGLPGIIAAVVVSPTTDVIANRLALTAASLAYIISLSLVLSAVAAFAHRAAPRAPRRLAAFIVLFPFALSFFSDGIPSIPGAYVWMFGRMIQWGGMAG